MSHESILRDILRGGLPAVLDGGATTNPIADPPRVEETPPEPQLRDREPFLMTPGLPTTILIGTAGLIGILAVILIARR